MDQQRAFSQNGMGYLVRLAIACASTGGSIFTLRITLAGGAGTHWGEALVAGLVLAGAAVFFTLDSVRHFYHMRRMAIVQDATPYGFAGPEPEQSAVDKLKRTHARPSKDLH